MIMTTAMRNTLKKIVHLETYHKPEVFFCFFLLCIPLLIFITNTAVTYVNKEIKVQRLSSIESSFKQEANVVLDKIKKAASEGEINKYIADNDRVNTSAILAELTKKYSLFGMTAVNGAGVAVARVPQSRTGDYVAQTTSWGRRAANGEPVVTIAVGRIFPLAVVAGVPIYENDKVTGALHGGYILDDAYAVNFKHKNLKDGEQIIFYSKTTGAYGDSFENEEIKPLLKTYFNNGTLWVQNGRSELGVIQFRLNGKVFNIGNIVLHDIDGNFIGGMLIFFPTSSYPSYVPSGIIGIILLLLIISHVLRKHKKNRLYQIAFPTISLLIILFTFIFYNSFIQKNIHSIKKLPYTIYNSTMALDPESDLFDKTSEHKLTIKITTGGESINAAQVTLIYDPKLIKVEDILMTNSFCDPGFILEKNIDNTKGEVTIACGKPNGFVGDTAILAELLIQPLKEGELTMKFGDDNQVLANDGLGTNVLRTVTNGAYQITDIKTQKSGPQQVLLFSDTHPNQARWYNQNNIHISWPQSAGYDDFIYVFDQNPDTVPDGTTHTTDTETSTVANSDGVYYFHLAPRKQNSVGQTSHLKIMVDTTPPTLPTIRVSEKKVRAGDVVRFEFSGSGDNLSGLQKNFYVRFGDDGVLFPVLPQLNVPFLEAGTYKIIFRVFDNAGNYSDSSEEISVN